VGPPELVGQTSCFLIDNPWPSIPTFRLPGRSLQNFAVPRYSAVCGTAAPAPHFGPWFPGQSAMDPVENLGVTWFQHLILGLAPNEAPVVEHSEIAGFVDSNHQIFRSFAAFTAISSRSLSSCSCKVVFEDGDQVIINLE
jgi:hypothetical protein